LTQTSVAQRRCPGLAKGQIFAQSFDFFSIYGRKLNRGEEKKNTKIREKWYFGKTEFLPKTDTNSLTCF
jgi:hypothetical protein